MLRYIFLTLYLASAAFGEVYFYEKFPDKDSLGQWIQSTHHSNEKRGTWSISASKSWSDGNLGLKTDQEARFYAISKKIPEPFTNKGKTLVVQYSVKFEKPITCSGSYLKILNTDLDQSTFHGESPYLFMFGPDMCGPLTKKVHAIFNYNGKNHLIKKEVPCKDDLYSHLYTFILTPDNKYKILIDNENAAEGVLEDDWDMLPPKKIDDPAAKKPADWVDEAEIVDPNDKKPEDWDKPKMIPDPDAKKPEDWDDEMDGEWERPQIDNPDYKGEWQPKKIPNPEYKGPWVAPQIDNPDYKPDSELYVMSNVGHVGFDLWQVTADVIFDDILITDDPDFAKSEGESIWRPRFNAEKEHERIENEKAEKEKPESDKETEEKPEPDEPDVVDEDASKKEELHEEL